MRVCKKGADEYSGKCNVIGQHPNHGQQADGKQNQIQQDDLLISLRCRGRNKLVHGEGGRGFPAFSGWLQEFLTGREVLVAVLASQVTSNVPAALLLSGFTAETQALIIGTNLGGLGTLIASMASLISYRQIARELPQGKKQYFGLFTLSNLIFLALLLGVWFLLR